MMMTLRSTEGRAVSAILLAALFNAASGAGIYFAHQADPHFSSTVGILIRVLANLSCLALPLFRRKGAPSFLTWRAGSELWLWGIFGALTIGTYYYSITLLGAGKATMVNAASGVFIVALAPVFTRQKLMPRYLIAALGCLGGMILLGNPSTGNADQLGILLAILSGLFSALAYLMVAKSGSRHSPETVLLHWTAVCLVALVLAFSLQTWVWPAHGLAWVVLLATGLLMAWSQYLTTVAYQQANASLIACLSFCGPLLNVVADFYLFSLPFSAWSVLGVALVLIFGLVIPLSAAQRQTLITP